MRTDPIEAFTFASLEEQIRALPPGPVSALDAPRWMRRASVLGVFGALIAFVPGLLVYWIEAQQWMVWLARAGFGLAVVGFLPGFVRNVWVLMREMRHHRRGLLAQFDHDVAALRTVAESLARYPREVLESNLRYARMGHDRLQSRVALMVGGMERLGLVPVFVALGTFAANWEGALALPGWALALGLLAPVFWLFGWFGADFTRRLQLYAFLLEEGLRRKDALDPGAQ